MTSSLRSIGRVRFKAAQPNIETMNMEGKFIKKLDPAARYMFPHLSNVFFVFDEQRVRYSKVMSKLCAKQNTCMLRVDDEDLLDELLTGEAVDICLDEDGVNAIDEENGFYDPEGMKVIWDGKEVGLIKHFFHNGAHYVYEIEMADKQVVLIPDVETFVIETNVSERFIRVVELNQFMDL